MLNIANFVIRPLQSFDFNQICQVADSVGFGFTSLPNNRDILAYYIEKSQKSFQEILPITERQFFLVMEDQDQKFVGMCGIKAQVGNKIPFYNYRISNITKVNQDFNIYLEHKILYLVNDFQNSSEIGTLYVNINYRGQGLGALLSRSRFLLMAQFPTWFASCTISEIRGVCDSVTGNSIFWQALGKKFFAMDFKEADYLTIARGKQFIVDLMPNYPIYLDLLPEEAQKVVGQAHFASLPAKKILENEDFSFQNYIDIFDAGPLLTANTNNIKSIKQSKLVTVNSYIKTKNINNVKFAIASNNTIDFRSKLIQYNSISEHEIELDQISAKLLNISIGDKIRICPYV